MDRRDFMKLAGATGLVLASPVPLRDAHAQETEYDGPLWVFVGAGGGWDPTSFCDPKGYLSEEQPDPMNQTYPTSDIGSQGNLSFAPIGYYPQFVQNHYEKMLVINGIDTQTNGHDSGRRHAGSGKLEEGFPAFGALVAAHYGQGLPMGFVTNGFYDDTAGTTPRTRVGNINAFERIAEPNMIRDDRRFHTEETMRRIEETQRSRLLALQEAQKLPRLEKSIGTLHLARSSENVLARLLELLPDDRPDGRVERQAQLAIAAYKAGACVSAVLSRGGFDTHGNHDQNHIPRLDQLFQGVDFLWQEAERQGVADNLVVCIGSDFGRTPGYNDGNGKDHWPVSSMILMGKGIRGNRTIGATTERHGLRTVDPNSLEVTEGGVRIHPGHIHRELRRLAGLDQTELAARFPLGMEQDLNLFE